jgi:glutamate-1-semialdehyde aminotransferase
MPKIDIAGRTERETDLMWTYFLQEAAKRGVLFRRGGLDFVCFSHTEEDVEHSVETASEVFENMERHRDRGTLETACRVQTPVLTAP